MYLPCVSAAMSENNRLTKVSSVIKAYGTIMRAHRGEVMCTVTTAKVMVLRTCLPVVVGEPSYCPVAYMYIVVTDTCTVVELCCPVT